MINSSFPKGREDRLIWKEEGKGVFSVRSHYVKLRGSTSISFPLKFVWGAHVPKKMAFFYLGDCLGKDFNY